MTNRHGSRRTMAILGAVCILGLLAVGSAVAAPSTFSAAQAPCGTFTGPGWTRVDPMARPVNQKGTAWRVTARGVPCAFALKESKRMVRTPFKGEAGTRLTSPKGWTCVAGGGYSGGGKGTSGSCTQGSKYFGWGPATKVAA